MDADGQRMETGGSRKPLWPGPGSFAPVNRALMVVGVLCLLTAGVGAYVVTTAPAKADDVAPVVEPDSRVALSFLLLDEQRTPFYTNSFAAGLVMARSQPSYTLQNASYYDLQHVPLDASFILGPAVRDALLGKAAGETIVTDYLTAEELGHGWAGEVRLAEVHGPFPLEETVPAADFERRVPSTAPDGTFALNYKYNATVVERTATHVTFRLQVEDGAVRALPEVKGHMVTEVVNGTHFVERVVIPEGTTFVRPNSRFLGLEPGTYQADRVEGGEIVLKHTTLRNPELVGRGAYVVAQIVDIE